MSRLDLCKASSARHRSRERSFTSAHFRFRALGVSVPIRFSSPISPVPWKIIDGQILKRPPDCTRPDCRASTTMDHVRRQTGISIGGHLIERVVCSVPSVLAALVGVRRIVDWSSWEMIFDASRCTCIVCVWRWVYPWM